MKLFYQTTTIIIGLIFLFIGFNSCQKSTPNVPEGFEIHPSFKMELVASEPLIFDPVDMEFDEAGRAFVLEMPGYPLRDKESRLILLKDNNDDGIYDERKVFADQLQLASSFMPYKNGILVAAPPDLLYIKDTDGDEVADERQTIMSGFSAGNLQHNYNGLTYGLDNWIYAANGGNSGHPYFVEDSSLNLNLRGDDFRFRLEPAQLERVGESSGGFELAFDQWGRMYETHNLEHVSQLVFDGRYLDGLPSSPAHPLTIISDHEENGLSRIYPIGEQETRVNHPEQSGYFSGSCGITFYGGGAFPEGFNDNLFVADVVLNLIHLDILAPNGAIMKTSRSREKVEFIASTDRSFRPVNLTAGPDGSLYLMDMYRAAIEHPEWIPDEMEVNMDLEAGKEKGRIYRIIPKGNWTKNPVQAISEDMTSRVKALENLNQWARTTAQRLLVESADETSIIPLEQMVAKSTKPLGRLHALWTLEGMGKLSNEILEKGLGDPVAGVRENALKIAEKRLNENSSLIDKVINLTEDVDARVRMQAALTLSMLNEDHQKAYEPQLHIALEKLLVHPSTDSWTALAIASAVKEQAATFSQQLLTQSNTTLTASQLQVLSTLVRLMGIEKQTDEIAQTLPLIAAQNTASGTQMIEAMAEGWGRGEAFNGILPDNLVSGLEMIESRGEIALVRAAAKLRKSIGLGISSQMQELIADAHTAIANGELAVEERLEMLRLIGLESFEKREATLYKMLDNRTPLALQKEALNQLGKANKKNIGEKLLDLWPGLGPEARKMAGNILLYKSQNHDLLLTALESGKINAGELNLDLERRRVLLFSRNEKVKQRAEALFSDAGVVKRKEAIENMRPALALKGDAAKGKLLFTSACSTCHQYGEEGQNVGPVLTEINRKSKESLLYEILDPNANVDTKYLNYSVRTKDGNILTGIIFNESDTELGLKMIGGNETVLNKKEIEEFTSLGISLMPEGLEAGMEPKDMADLLAFLQNGAK